MLYINKDIIIKKTYTRTHHTHTHTTHTNTPHTHTHTQYGQNSEIREVTAVGSYCTYSNLT